MSANTVPTKTAEQWAGGTVHLARLFKINSTAVTFWGEFMPRGRVYELRELKPDWFNLNGSIKRVPAAVLTRNMAANPKLKA